MNLWLDDERPAPDDTWIHVRTFDQAKFILSNCWIDHMSLDHDLGRPETGYDFVKWCAEHDQWSYYKPTVHSQNPAGAESMRKTIERYFHER